MQPTASKVIAKSGITARIEHDPAAAGDYQLVFRRAARVARLPCRGSAPVSDDPAVLLEAAMRETAFFDECDDSLEWADGLGLDIGDPSVLAEFRVVLNARDVLIELIGTSAYDALQLELAMGQAIRAAAAGLKEEER